MEMKPDQAIAWSGKVRVEISRERHPLAGLLADRDVGAPDFQRK